MQMVLKFLRRLNEGHFKKLKLLKNNDAPEYTTSMLNDKFNPSDLVKVQSSIIHQENITNCYLKYICIRILLKQ